jgi:NTE family protein
VHRTTFLREVPSILVRLPMGFAIPFVLLFVFWTIFLFKEFNKYLDVRTFDPFKAIPLLSRLDDLLIGAVLVLFYIIGLLIAYNLAVLINLVLNRYIMNSSYAPAVHPQRPAASPVESDRFKNIEKIGIVLAGGGAKGAFQAGAMKAIYRFLAEHNALHKVKVISGTSIGAWNALFWLSDLIKSDREWDEPGVHENWWRSIKLRSLVAPSYYLPFWTNAFFETTPWQQTFDNVFGQADVKQQIINSDIHFYLTRSDVKTGKLRCTTNYQHAPHIPKVRYNWLDRSKGADEFLEGVKFGVFASMDLPPLFPYMRKDGDFFEDGGVIDNLPVLFAAMECCDLIFVLPLNSDFNAVPNRRSVLKRLLRVMDIRQGALERGSLKDLYLYNELAVLRNYVSALESKIVEAKIELPTIEVSETLQRALKRTHQPSKLFGICPLKAFAESTINTQELWKSKNAGYAFNVMRRATAEVLKFKFDPNQERIKIALVDYAGGITWDEDF